MLTKKGITWIIVSIIILGFILGLDNNLVIHEIGFLWATIIILTGILAKEFAGNYFYVVIEHKIWEFQRWGWYARSQFKKPLPAGLIFPFFMTIVSLGIIKPLMLLQFEGKPSKKRILRKRGNHRSAEVNESDFAFIAAWSFWALIILAVIAAIFKQPELAKYSIFYGTWNLIPFGQLDGSKLFFGSLFNWIVLVIIYLISMALVLV
jgi:hypothetical protein